jgi:hypothetical protein
MHRGAKVVVIDIAHTRHERVAERGNLTGPSVGLRLSNVAGTRDYRADTMLLGNPREGDLRR